MVAILMTLVTLLTAGNQLCLLHLKFCLSFGKRAVMEAVFWRARKSCQNVSAAAAAALLRSTGGSTPLILGFMSPGSLEDNLKRHMR